MNLNETLRIGGIPLEETITQIIKRVNKYKATTKSAEELTKRLASDSALRDSLGAIESATPEEQKQYADFIKDPIVAGAIDNLPTPMKSSFNKLKDISPAEEPAEQAKPVAPAPDALKTLDPQMKAKLSQMQKEWFSKKTSQEKQSLVAAWSKDSIAARLYKFGLRQGIFAMPKVTS
jgi:hypothetical protein